MAQRILFFVSLILVLLGFGPFVLAEEKEGSPIQVESAYAFGTMPGARSGAAFMVIHNEGKEDDRLVEAETEVAGITEIHENYNVDDGKVMMMRKIKGVDIAAGDSAALHPKGKHIMLLKLAEPLTIGKTFPLTLTFEKTGVQIVHVEIIQPGTKPDAE